MGKKLTITIDVTEMGRNGGKATALNRTPAERKAAATKAAKDRWAQYYEAHPEALKKKARRSKKASRPRS